MGRPRPPDELCCCMGQKGTTRNGEEWRPEPDLVTIMYKSKGMKNESQPKFRSKIFVCKIFPGQNFYMFTCSLRRHNRRNLSTLLQIILKCSRTRVMSTTPMLQIRAPAPPQTQQHHLWLRRDKVDDTQYHILYSLLYD